MASNYRYLDSLYAAADDRMDICLVTVAYYWVFLTRCVKVYILIKYDEIH
jgi:hypothetical protein